MIKRIVLLLFLIVSSFSYAQDYSAQWQGYFSYYDIKDVSQGNNKIYAAAENAVFSYDIITNELKTITTVNGLSGETISAIHYSETYELLIIGYENGLLEIAFDDENDVLTIVDIFDKPTIPPNDKNIIHFNEHDGLVYISTEYGISVYDLERLEFGDTYYLGDSGSQITIAQTVVYDEYIYAACQTGGRGFRKAPVSSTNLIDYDTWERVATGNYFATVSNGSKLYTCRANRKFYEVVGDVFTELFRFDHRPLDIRNVGDKLIATTKNDVYVYDIDFNLLSRVSVSESLPTEFTSATIDEDYIYIGTKDFGLIKTLISDPITYEEIRPDGPLLNIAFSLKASSNNLWVSFGDYTLSFVPGPMRQRGLSHLKNEEWFNIPFDSVLTARNLNAISINPFVEDQVFISSFQDGLLEINDNIPTILHNQTNSGLESLVVPTDPSVISIRQCASSFDRNGLLWTMTARADRPLKSYDPSTDQWQGYTFTEILDDPFDDEWGFYQLSIDNNGTKWIGGYNKGLIGYNENNTGDKSAAIFSEEQNMPSSLVTALAADQRNQIWIGTNKGLRVLYNSSTFFTDPNPIVNEIVILEDGVPKELLFQQFITDIEVDGSNNKWVATNTSGVFYFSSDGQETIYHFTKDNSPLPSNGVVDMSIDPSNGTVYIATDKGLVSFGAGGSAPIESLENAFVFPNPVRPTFNITEDKVKIKDIAKNVNIKITDIEGNLVAEAETRTNTRYKGYNLEIDGGTAFWNGKNLSNNVVSSGVYLVMLSDLETLDTKVLKIMVVR